MGQLVRASSTEASLPHALSILISKSDYEVKQLPSLLAANWLIWAMRSPRSRKPRVQLTAQLEWIDSSTLHFLLLPLLVLATEYGGGGILRLNLLKVQGRENCSHLNK